VQAGSTINITEAAGNPETTFFLGSQAHDTVYMTLLNYGQIHLAGGDNNFFLKGNSDNEGVIILNGGHLGIASDNLSFLNNGVIYAQSGALTMGALTGKGAILIGNNAVAVISGAAPTQLVDFGNLFSNSIDATLEISNPAGFDAQIYGFGPSDFIKVGADLSKLQVIHPNSSVTELEEVSTSGSISGVLFLHGNYAGKNFAVADNASQHQSTIVET
jgi:hypothetical protein